MHVARLTLRNVRTFRRLDLPLEPGIHLLVGPNASGKTNLLEAIVLLATTRLTRRGQADRDVISWTAMAEDPLPAARLSADVQTLGEPVTVEVVVATRETMPARAAPADAADQRVDDSPPPATSRRFRVNDVARRASDLIGRLRVVPFSADDLSIIDGPPANRRRYLDITISQIDSQYVRALQRYNRVLQQRNSLLRRLRERHGRADELDFWDEELARAGAVIVDGRAQALTALGQLAAARHAELAPEEAALTLEYHPAALSPGPPPGPGDSAAPDADRDPATTEAHIAVALRAGRERDIHAGVTRTGPHRDDFSFLLGGHEAGPLASRGQQRTVALALRLAELTLSTERTGESPVLLLDDVLSELDAERRARVLGAAYQADQVLITSADEDRPAPHELPGATRYQLRDGAVERRAAPLASAQDSPSSG